VLKRLEEFTFGLFLSLSGLKKGKMKGGFANLIGSTDLTKHVSFSLETMSYAKTTYTPKPKSINLFKSFEKI